MEKHTNSDQQGYPECIQNNLWLHQQYAFKLSSYTQTYTIKIYLVAYLLSLLTLFEHSITS